MSGCRSEEALHFYNPYHAPRGTEPHGVALLECGRALVVVQGVWIALLCAPVSSCVDLSLLGGMRTR